MAKNMTECYGMENGAGGTRKKDDDHYGDENGARATRGRYRYDYKRPENVKTELARELRC